MELKGKFAVVTGGAVRIGRALSISLAKAGCNVLIHYFQSKNHALEVKKIAESHQVKAVTHSANLSKFEETLGVIQAAIDQFGKVDILINNAAIFPRLDTFKNSDKSLWDKIFNINLRAPFFLSRAFSEQIPENGNGKIININDARISRPSPDHFVYRLSKSGLSDMTQMLALELAPRVSVNTLALGAILAPAGEAGEYMKIRSRNRIPLKKIGSPNEVAQNVIHLLHQDFLTGATIKMDGGEYLKQN